MSDCLKVLPPTGGEDLCTASSGGGAMNKKAISGLMLALVLPIAGYFIVKYYGENAVHMPGRYFLPDSVVVKEKNGKNCNRYHLA